MDRSTRRALEEAAGGALVAVAAIAAAGLASATALAAGYAKWAPARVVSLGLPLALLAAIGAAAAVVALGARRARRRRGGRAVAAAALLGVFAAGGVALSPAPTPAWGPLLAALGAGGLAGAALLRRGTTA
ncbi:MAG: hypothetical protein M9894_39135 [Planctomycetes bacterium]|nr:hypothetical protein [Planctomycetota bacterium]